MIDPDLDVRFEAPGGAPPVLLLHGLTGTPRSMRPMAEALSGRGHRVVAPVLPGHASVIEDLEGVVFSDLLAAATAELEALVKDVGPAVIVGHSVGGTLACALACATKRAGVIAGLVLLNPFLEPPTPSFNGLLRAALSTGNALLPSVGADLKKKGVATGGYDAMPVASVLDLSEELARLRPRLGSIDCPVLLFESRVDHVVPALSAMFLKDELSGPVKAIVLEDSYHVAMLDNDAALVTDTTVAFLESMSR